MSENEALNLAVEMLAHAEGIDPGIARCRRYSSNKALEKRLDDVWCHAFAVGVRATLDHLGLLDVAKDHLEASDA